ncbi:MAG: hypothetical protein H6Q66_2851 [Firmicutes bacterium]|nr:hypothetical protein [Bacillota bacterium]
MKQTNKHKATVTLIFVTAGYLASYPFQCTFAGGLLTGGFGAAMVGGLADWFAVSALFRRPLGISFRTAVIPRNRERIFATIIEMVQNQLLTAENIGQTLDRFDMTDMLLRYWEEHGGRKDVQDMLTRIAGDMLQQTDAQELARILEKMIRRGANRVEVAPLVAEALDWSVRNGYDKKIANFLLVELCNIIEREQFRATLANLFREAKEVYERDLFRRRMANHLLEYLLGLSPERMAAVAQEKLIAVLQNEENLSALHNRLRNWVDALSRRLTSDPVFRQSIEAWKNEMVNRHLHISKQIAETVISLQALGKERLAVDGSWRAVLERQSDQAVRSLAGNREQRTKISRVAKNVFLETIAAHHEEIGSIVRIRLEQFSDSALADFIESRVGNDLQMIRINGSVVGGLAGMALFLLSYLAGNI